MKDAKRHFVSGVGWRFTACGRTRDRGAVYVTNRPENVTCKTCARLLCNKTIVGAKV